MKIHVKINCINYYEPIDPAITDDGHSFDNNNCDEWKAEGASTDSDNDFIEKKRARSINFFLF